MKKERAERPDIAITLGYIAVKDRETLAEKVVILKQLGYTTKDIAAICGTNEASVRASHSQITKKTTRVKGKKKK